MPDSPKFTPKTSIIIDGENFLINGIPTQQGRTFRCTWICQNSVLTMKPERPKFIIGLCI
ncbi:MAG: hypothetical protein O2974_11365 [Chloroflexi bacterium]|nr:hypothetical protein [Chloroflexota bacterium]